MALNYLPIPEAIEPTKDKILELLPKNTHEENTSLVPASVDTKVEDLTDERRLVLRVTNSVQLCPLLTMTTVTTVTTCTHYADGDPKMPIPVPHGADVDLDELITELSVPVPHIRQYPYIGIGDPINGGGVTTSGFRVREEPMQTREAYQETQQVENFQRSGPLLGVRAEHIRKQGMSGSQQTTWIYIHVQSNLPYPGIVSHLTQRSKKPCKLKIRYFSRTWYITIMCKFMIRQCP